jgi:hypothetical protein
VTRAGEKLSDVYFEDEPGRTPLPTAAELDAVFVVMDSAGQKPAYLYFDDPHTAAARRSATRS